MGGKTIGGKIRGDSHKKGWGYSLYLLGVKVHSGRFYVTRVSELIHFKPRTQNRILVPLRGGGGGGVVFKVSDEHPRHFYMVWEFPLNRTRINMSICRDIGMVFRLSNALIITK